MKKRKLGGVHQYLGGRSSRGKRAISKLYRGIKVGDLEKAFAEVDRLNGK